jgi:hypothetical protein
MDNEQLVSRWHKAGEKVFQAMAAWRQAHPHATFAEIEAAVEDRLGVLRAEVIEDTVATADEPRSAGAERPRCAECGHGLEGRGIRERVVTVRGNRLVRLRRHYLGCPACGAGFFPPG